MNIIQFGSMAILLKWMLLALAIVLGLIILKLWLSRTQPAEIISNCFDVITNSIFLGFIFWKGSLILFEPKLVMNSPLSLLYFTGGNNGFILAIIFSIVYFILKTRKVSILIRVQIIFLYSLTVSMFYQFLSIFLIENHDVYHFLLGVFSLILLALSLFKKRLMSLPTIFSMIIIFSFYNIILSIVFLNIENKFMIFTIEQWFFISLILFSLFFLEKKFIS